jgi:hypothetical protein
MPGVITTFPKGLGKMSYLLVLGGVVGAGAFVAAGVEVSEA